MDKYNIYLYISTVAYPALAVRGEGKVKEPSWFLPFLSDFSSFFPIFPLFFPIFGKFFTVRGDTTPLAPQWLCRCISNSIEKFKLNQDWNFQLILSMSFHFMRHFANSIIFRVSHRLLYCVLIEVAFEKMENARNIHISSKVNLEC